MDRELLGIIATIFIAGVVALLSHVFAARKDEPGRRRADRDGDQPDEGDRSRRATKDMERFLEEINRRRRQATERPPSSTPQPAQSVERPIVLIPVNAPVPPRPQPVIRTQTEPSPPALQPKRPEPAQSTPGRQRSTAKATPVPEPPVAPIAVPAPAMPQLISPRDLPVQMNDLSNLLASRQSVQMAIVLKAIFDPPPSRRRRYTNGPQ